MSLGSSCIAHNSLLYSSNLVVICVTESGAFAVNLVWYGLWLGLQRLVKSRWLYLRCKLSVLFLSGARPLACVMELFHTFCTRLPLFFSFSPLPLLPCAVAPNTTITPIRIILLLLLLLFSSSTKQTTALPSHAHSSFLPRLPALLHFAPPLVLFPSHLNPGSARPPARRLTGKLKLTDPPAWDFHFPLGALFAFPSHLLPLLTYPSLPSASPLHLSLSLSSSLFLSSSRHQFNRSRNSTNVYFLSTLRAARRSACSPIVVCALTRRLRLTDLQNPTLRLIRPGSFDDNRTL